MLKWLGRALLALVALVAIAYPLADLLRDPLTEKARAELKEEGKLDRLVQLPLGTMHVRVKGAADATVVLLVHGGAVGGYGFQNWQQPLVDAGFRVIVPDLLGYGFSDRPETPYTKQFYIDQLDQLLKGLDIKAPVHIVGASLGGAIVTAFAAHDPARVKSVTLIAPAGNGRSPVVSDFLLWPVVGDWMFRVVGARMTQDMLARAYENSPDREAMMTWMADQSRFRGFAEGMLNTLRNYDALWQPDDYEALGRSHLPVLAVWGTADTVNPFAQSQVLRSRVPQVTLAPMEGKGHALTFGETGAVLEIVVPFLKNVDAPLAVP